MANERCGSKAPSKVDLESPDGLAVLFPCNWHEPNVCDPYKAVLVAARKIDLELARKVLAHGVAQKEPCYCHRIWSCVKCFVGADSGKVAAHDVSDCVATRLPCS